MSHPLAQTLLVSPHPRLADSAHCFKGLPWTGLWHPNAPYCLSNQLPRQAWLSCSLKVNIYLSLLLCTDACLLRHSTFRLTKICSDSDHLSGEMTENKVWLINLRGIFQWSSSPRVGRKLGSTLGPSQPENLVHRARRGQRLLHKLFWELTCQLCAEAAVLCLQQSYMLLCVQQQHTYIKQVNLLNQRAGIMTLVL